MGKINFSLERELESLYDTENDFGFSAVSEDELKSMERQLQQQVIQTEKQLTLTSKEYKDRMEALYKLIMPLLINLQKDPDKEYILWPDRSKKMTAFIDKVNKIVEND
jgi:DnaJ-domain-containing protein 1